MNERFTQVPNQLIIDKNLDAYEFRILSYLISCSSKDGICFPGKKDIAEKTFISESHVKRKLKSLEENKYIKKTNRTIGSGKKTTNLYKLHKKLIVTKEYRGEENEKQSVELYDYDWINENEEE